MFALNKSMSPTERKKREGKRSVTNHTITDWASIASEMTSHLTLYV